MSGIDTGRAVRDTSPSHMGGLEPGLPSWQDAFPNSTAGRSKMRESFEHFYLTKVALGEGCGCAEHVTRIREIDTLCARTARRGVAVPDRRRPLLGLAGAAFPKARGTAATRARRDLLTPIPEPVGDRIAAVAAEILLGDLHARARPAGACIRRCRAGARRAAPSRGRGPLATIASTSISFSTRLSRMSSSTG